MFKRFMVACLFLAGCSAETKTIPSASPSATKQSVQVDPVKIGPEKEVKSRLQLLFPVFHAMVVQEGEKLPFDEPRHENGRQLDGKLRPNWIKAYFKKEPWYAFEGSSYRTMGANNVPLIPQVCADFIVDTIDRSAGTWYASNLKHPQRIVGKFDFRSQMMKAKFEPRNANDLPRYFKTRPDDFLILFEGEGPEVGNASLLKEWMFNLELQIGDIVIIKGLAPWDHGKEIHYHSFFITRMDDNGKVAMIIGNAGYPEEWTIGREVKRAPKRKPIAIIRMTDHFLESLQ